MKTAPPKRTAPLVLRHLVRNVQPLTPALAQRLETLMTECIGLDTRPFETGHRSMPDRHAERSSS
jgi:hypothetical protein